MADAWTTVVHRESEWTPAARSEAMAAVLAKKLVCPNCGNTNTIVEVPIRVAIGSRWVWPARAEKDKPGDDEQIFDLRQYRCVACAGVNVLERAIDEAHKPKGDAPTPAGRMEHGDAAFIRAVPRLPTS